MKPSAICSVFRCRPAHAACLLWLVLTSAWALGTPCGPPPQIRVQLEKVTVTVTGPADFDRGLAPLLALRQRYPGELWVNERYQDAVQQYGIEGHLRKMTEDYQVLSMRHPDNLMYSYLYARSLMGRNTPSAIQQMAEMIASHPDFAPAHGSLAEIYSSAMFRDQPKEKVERERFLTLCPAGVVEQRPASLPDPSPLVDQAERLLAQNGDPDRITEIALQSVQDDEWRLQRIRPFDWYGIDYKRQAQRELQAKYWRLWAVQVRCQRLAGRPGKADELLVAMEQRAAALRRDSIPVYWDAMVTLVHLYEEGNRKDLATHNLDSMQEFLATHPDPGRPAQLEELRKQVESSRK